jgi:predicted cupin superfamily sugar epimerase
MLTDQKIIRLLKLKPLPGEGGFYRETYRSALRTNCGAKVKRSLGTAIYYLITPENFSALHRISSDEIFHFYSGDPAELFLFGPGGKTRRVILGPDIGQGQHSQFLVPGNVWQGTRLLQGGSFALLGTTVFPGFDLKDYRQGERDKLMKLFPRHQKIIHALTR